MLLNSESPKSSSGEAKLSKHLWIQCQIGNSLNSCPHAVPMRLSSMTASAVTKLLSIVRLMVSTLGGMVSAIRSAQKERLLGGPSQVESVATSLMLAVLEVGKRTHFIRMECQVAVAEASV